MALDYPLRAYIGSNEELAAISKSPGNLRLNTSTGNLSFDSLSNDTIPVVSYNGWSPVLSLATDGNRVVLKINNWSGGTGTMPPIGQYIGSTGLVSNIAQALDIRGIQGPEGTSGTPIIVTDTLPESGVSPGTFIALTTPQEAVPGPKGEIGYHGWSPLIVGVISNEKCLLQVTDWIGGQGDKPIITLPLYIGDGMLTNNINDAIDFRGKIGQQGPQGPAGSGEGGGTTLPNRVIVSTTMDLVNAMVSGASNKVIIIDGDLYDESALQITLYGNNILVDGAAGSLRVTPTESGMFLPEGLFVNGTNITIKNLTIYGDITLSGCKNFTLDNCVVHGSITLGTPMPNKPPTSVRIIHNVIKSNLVSHMVSGSGSAFITENVFGGTVTINSTFTQQKSINNITEASLTLWGL